MLMTALLSVLLAYPLLWLVHWPGPVEVLCGMVIGAVVGRWGGRRFADIDRRTRHDGEGQTSL